MTKTILRVEDVAEQLKRSPQTIYRWIRNGKFPKGKPAPGGMIWTQAKLEKWASYGQVSDKELKAMASGN